MTKQFLLATTFALSLGLLFDCSKKKDEPAPTPVPTTTGTTSGTTSGTTTTSGSTTTGSTTTGNAGTGTTTATGTSPNATTPLALNTWRISDKNYVIGAGGGKTPYWEERIAIYAEAGNAGTKNSSLYVTFNSSNPAAGTYTLTDFISPYADPYSEAGLQVLYEGQKYSSYDKLGGSINVTKVGRKLTISFTNVKLAITSTGNFIYLSANFECDVKLIPTTGGSFSFADLVVPSNKVFEFINTNYQLAFTNYTLPTSSYMNMTFMKKPLSPKVYNVVATNPTNENEVQLNLTAPDYDRYVPSATGKTMNLSISSDSTYTFEIDNIPLSGKTESGMVIPASSVTGSVRYRAQ